MYSPCKEIPKHAGEEALTRREFEKVEAVVDTVEGTLALKMGVATAMRREDLAAVRIENLDLAGRTVTFWESKKRRMWTVTFSPEVARIIAQWLHVRGNPRKGRLFKHCGKSFYNWLHVWCDAAGISRRRWHALRATFYKFAKEKGWSDEQITKQTGDSLEVLRKYYGVASPGEMNEVSEEKAVV